MSEEISWKGSPGDGDLARAFSFLATAESAIDRGVERGESQALYGVLFNYHHALELAFKVLIRLAHRPGSPKFTPQENRALEGHSLAVLADVLNSRLVSIGASPLPKSVLDTALLLHNVSPDGIALRYAQQTTGKGNEHTLGGDGWIDVHPTIFRKRMGTACRYLLVKLHSRLVWTGTITDGDRTRVVRVREARPRPKSWPGTESVLVKKNG